jgi:hypothetical protein
MGIAAFILQLFLTIIFVIVFKQQIETKGLDGATSIAILLFLCMVVIPLCYIAQTLLLG